MDYLLNLLEMEIIIRLTLAAFLGFVIGLERELTGHPAGERTHTLVALGAATFALISSNAFPDGDTSRIAAGVVTGLGFLGAGAILKTGANEIHGLTTATGIWVVGAIGLAIGSGMFQLGIVTAVLVGLVLISERILKTDRRLARLRKRKENPETSAD